jgi:flagellar basal body-associated protein FliL
VITLAPPEDDQMMGDMSGMMMGMGLLWLLLIVVVVLVAAAAIKYLFFDKRGKD